MFSIKEKFALEARIANMVWHSFRATKREKEHLCALGVLSRGYAPCSAAHRACPALIPLGLNYTRHSGPKCTPDGSIGGAGAKICDPFCRFVPRSAVMRRESKRAAEAFSAPHCPLVGAWAPRWVEQHIIWQMDECTALNTQSLIVIAFRPRCVSAAATGKLVSCYATLVVPTLLFSQPPECVSGGWR